MEDRYKRNSDELNLHPVKPVGGREEYKRAHRYRKDNKWAPLLHLASLEKSYVFTARSKIQMPGLVSIYM